MIHFSQKLPSLVCILLCVEFSAHAQTPERTTATYGDWTASCATPPSGEKSCELIQSQILQGQTTPTSQITIARTTKNGPLKIFVQVPTNVLFQSGVIFRVDDIEAGVTATLRWCAPSRCLADAELSDAVIKKLSSAAEPGALSWKDPSQQEVKIPVSLKGFLPALNAVTQIQNPAPQSLKIAEEDVRRFDGTWSIESECQAIPPNVGKANWKTSGKIENGKLSAKFGDEGKPGSGKFVGMIAANGHIEIVTSGLTGDIKFNTNNVAEKTPYTWKSIGSLSDSRGTATRIEGRFCVVNFSRDKK